MLRTNIQLTNSGNYTVVVTNSSGSITSSIAKLTVNPLYTPVFSDNFDVNSSASWTLNRSSTDTRAIFAYDYTDIGVPVAPHSTNSTKKGLRFEANLTTGAAAALNVSPIGQNFGANYRLHFDMWINANGPFPAGGTGSSEHLTAGVGTAGNRVQWNSGTSDGSWFAIDGEGQASDSAPDIRAYLGTTLQTNTSGVYAGGVASDVRRCSNPYYANVFPGGQTAPAIQQSAYPQQTGSLSVGTVGMAWRDVVISKSNNIVEWFIDGLKIASVTNTLTANNIFVGYLDGFTSLSDNTNLSFGLIDNLRVEVPVVAPSIDFNPQPLIVGQGSNATFNVTASGTPAPTFQWRFNGTNIPNETASSYTRTSVQPSDAGNYSVLVTNIGGFTNSIEAALTVIVPPTITAPPTDLIANAGGNGSFSVTATGTGPMAYQWQFNKVDIADETNSIYALVNVQPTQAGSYSVMVSNAANFTTSSNAFLTVTQVQTSDFSLNASGVFQMTVSGAPGSGYTVYGSTNLTDWDVLGTFNNPSGTFQFTDTNSTNIPQRFYRIDAP